MFPILRESNGITGHILLMVMTNPEDREAETHYACYDLGLELSTFYFHLHFIDQTKPYGHAQYLRDRKFILHLVELQNHITKGIGIERRKELGIKINLLVAKHNDQCFMFILWNSIVTLQGRRLVHSCGLSPWHSECHTSPGFPSTFLATHSQALFLSSPLSLWQSERR